MSFDFRNLEHYRDLPDRLVINVSGGRSSGYQMAHIAAACDGNFKPDWIFVFENTSLERPETYDFLWRLDNYFGLNLLWLERDPNVKGKVRVTDYFNAARNGEVMDALLNTPLKRRDGTVGVRPLPNPAQRTCTAEMKTKTVHRYVRQHLGWPTAYYSAIGFRADEPKRVERRRKMDDKKGFGAESGRGIFPMFDAGVVQDDVERFFRTGPFDLELDSDFGNCDLCFMASTWKLKQRMVHIALETQTRMRPGTPPPERVQRWIDWEERKSDRPGTFRKDRPSVRELWEQVCAGDFESAVPEGQEDRCGSCTD